MTKRFNNLTYIFPLKCQNIRSNVLAFKIDSLPSDQCHKESVGNRKKNKADLSNDYCARQRGENKKQGHLRVEINQQEKERAEWDNKNRKIVNMVKNNYRCQGSNQVDINIAELR